MVLPVPLQLLVAVLYRLSRPQLGGHEEEGALGHDGPAQDGEERQEVHEDLRRKNGDVLKIA